MAALPQIPVFLPDSLSERIARFIMEFGVDRTFGEYEEWPHSIVTHPTNYQRVRTVLRRYFDALEDALEAGPGQEMMPLPEVQGVIEATAVSTRDPSLSTLATLVEQQQEEISYLRWRLAGEQYGFMERALDEDADDDVH